MEERMVVVVDKEVGWKIRFVGSGGGGGGG
jgi:hypothetical protein